MTDALTYRYADQAALNFHGNTSYAAKLQAVEKKEKLLRAERQFYYLDLITRFIRAPLGSNV